MISIEERVRNLPRLARNVLAGNAGKGVTSLKASESSKLTIGEVDKLLKENGVEDVQERMAVKLDLEAAGFMESSPATRKPSTYL
jgi:hypothetical protein